MFPLLCYVQNRKYILAMSHRKFVKNLSIKDEETALLQLNIDYLLISCIVSVTVAEGMANKASQ